jgi:hypothetical protein
VLLKTPRAVTGLVPISTIEFRRRWRKLCCWAKIATVWVLSPDTGFQDRASWALW